MREGGVTTQSTHAHSHTRVTLEKYVGLPLANGMLMTGRPLSLDDALRHGLLNEVLELTDLTGRLEQRFRVATDGGFMTITSEEG